MLHLHILNILKQGYSNLTHIEQLCDIYDVI